MKKEQPGLSLHGTTWDAKHLDKFLSSQWGERLFNTKQSQDSYSKPLANFDNCSIRPSMSFLAVSRNNVPVYDAPPNSGPSALTHSRSPQPSNWNQISDKISRLHQKKSLCEAQESKVLPPKKKKELFESIKNYQEEINALKKQKLEIIKKNRILEKGYPNGVLGVPSESTTRNNQNSARIRRYARALNIMKHTGTNSGIEFGHSLSTDQVPEKPSGIKYLRNSMPQHYHNTHRELFCPQEKTKSAQREKRLKEVWRGNRDFNIISGAYFET